MKNELKPTLWRTARVLANVDRLNLMRLVVNANGKSGVCELALEADLPVPIASIYLRALNARGLISVVRHGSHVYYGTNSDRSLPIAVALQKAFRGIFLKKEMPPNWENSFLPIFKAYSNQRREKMISILSENNRMSYKEFQNLVRLGDCSFSRHLKILINAGLVKYDSKGLYSLAKPKNSVEMILLAASNARA